MSEMKRLLEKLHPDNIPPFSPKMVAIMGAFLNQDWASPTRGGPLGAFSVTSDGFVMSGNHFLGTAADFESNIKLYVEAAKLNGAERAYWDELYARKVTDWRLHRGAAMVGGEI